MMIRKFNENKNTNNLYLCFYIGDGGARESCSVYYSELVEASGEKEALEIYFKSGKAFAYDEGDPIGDYGVEKMNIIK